MIEAAPKADEFFGDADSCGDKDETCREPSEGPGTIIGRYKLLHKIGEGGMGVVYLAEQTQPVVRKVALKIIKLGMDTRQVVLRFEAERQALAMMDHPGIARVFDGGATEGGRPYFVMELVHGIPITEFCNKNKLTALQRLKLFISVCKAIQSAHQKGLIHRDIKPGNVLVTVDPEPMPKIIDFGIAKAINQKLTEKTLFTNYATMIGTPAYMSPEQAEMNNIDVDTRTDVYSLGVLLYELLTGTTPLTEERLRDAGFAEIQRMILEEEPEKPSTRVSTMSTAEKTAPGQAGGSDISRMGKLLQGDVDCIVMKCLEKDRRRRYETALALAEDTERFLNNQPVIARPPTALYRLQRTFGRNKVGFIAAGAVSLVLALGTIISAWQAIRATRAENAADIARGAAVQNARRAMEDSIRATTAENRANDSLATARRGLYVANMNLAQSSFEQNNVSRVRQLLEETEGSPHRGFEWYYWQKQTHLDLKTFGGHSLMINSVAFSPDGERIVTGSSDWRAKVWDVKAGTELLTLQGHSGEINSVGFSPDALRIVTGSRDGTARLWNAATGKEVVRFGGHDAPVNSCAFSPDGQRVATGGDDQTLRIWEAATGTELLTIRQHTKVLSVAFSPDGRRILSGTRDGNATLWNGSSGEELLTLKGHTGPITSVGFSQDGHRIVTGSADTLAKVWDIPSGKELFALRGHKSMINSVAFSPEGRLIATGGDDQLVKIWEAVSGKELLTFKGHICPVNSVAFAPDGHSVATASGDWTTVGSETKLWDAEGSKAPVLNAHPGRIFSAAFSQDGQQIVTANDDGTARTWEVNSGKSLLTIKGDGVPLYSAAFSPDGGRIVTGGVDRTARVWDVADGEPRLTLKGHSDVICSVAFSPDGQQILTGSADWTAKLWNALDGKELATLKGHKAWVWSAAFSPDGKRIVTGSNDNTVRLWDAVTGRELFTLKGHNSLVVAVAFSADGKRVLSGSSDRTAKLWDAMTGNELLTFKGHSDQIWAVAFSPDGQRILTGCKDATSKLWEAESGKELLTFQGHSEAVRTVAFGPDARRIVTGSWDRRAIIWEAATAQQVLAWKNEEKKIAERIATLPRELDAQAEENRIARRQDPGAIKKWLVLAPIPFESQMAEKALREEQLPREAYLQPRAGDRVKIGERELTWRSVQLEDSGLDFSALAGTQASWSAALAVCYIQSDVLQTGLLVKIGSDDQSKVYLNGKEVYHHAHSRHFVPDQDVVSGVVLEAGFNTVVFKVLNENEHWEASLHFTDAAGRPLKGITVTLVLPSSQK
jgi:WD40 repeat protein/serine/threonine protein kinase